MTIWTIDRIKEIALVLLAGVLVGFGIGRRRYIGKMPRY